MSRGDAVALETLSGREEYVIEEIRIVAPEEVGVLESTAGPVLTLVTCYPFYLVGHAPQRYIVRALRRDSGTWKTALHQVEGNSGGR